MGTSILIFHVSGGSSAVAIASPVPASSLASSFTAYPCPTLLSLVTCQWASDSARNANFGASFKTLISRIDNDTETGSPRSQVQVAWVGHRTEDTGRRTDGAGSGTGIRAEVDSERSRALQVLVQRMCAGRDLSLAGPSYQLATWPPTQAIHGFHMPATASHCQPCPGQLIHPFAVAVRVCSWLYPVALAGNLCGSPAPWPPFHAPSR